MENFGKEKEGTYLLEIDAFTPVDEQKTEAYLKDLKRYLISGKKTAESLTAEVYPVRYAFFQSGDYPKKDYPVFDPEKGTAGLVEQKDELPRESSDQGAIPFEFSAKTALQMLNLQNKGRGILKTAFLQTLRKVINGLNELLILHGDTSNLSDFHLDFAEDLISFDKIKEVTLSSVSSRIPKSRLTRLKAALQILTSAQESYAQGAMTIFASEEVMSSFNLEDIFDHVKIEVAPGNPCRQANQHAKKNRDEFVETIAALRVGRLMIDQEYDEALHDDYFDHFDLDHLTEEDLKYLHPTMVIEDARRLVLQSNDFLALLSKNSFVKILALNYLDDLFVLNDQEEFDYLELGSLAIFQRNSYVFQGGIDRPSVLNESYRKGLEYPGAVFWNILIPSGVAEQDATTFAALKAAIESRYFPRMEYEAEEDHFSGHHINLDNNPEPEVYFAGYELTTKTPSGPAPLTIGYTIADFLAMDSELMKTLEIIPPEYQSAKLIALHEYLSEPKDSLAGKFPFIWVVDGQKKLKKAAIPVYWIQHCRNRLEYWSFLQSISGTIKAHWQNAIEEVRSDWERAKKEEIEALKTSLQEQHEKERAGDLQKAISRMLYKLLNQGDSLESVLTHIGQEAFKPQVEVPDEQTSSKEEQAKQEESPPENEQVRQGKEEPKGIVREEAWVESDECTSCRDCIDALPAVFTYNENKQAYVHNPKGGTFAEIVKVAERCPARCIHPGVPQNKNEPSLDKWVKRAEKFN